MKIAVIANCHVQPLTRGLSSLPGVQAVIGLPTHLYGTPPFTKALESFRAFLDSDDVRILTFAHGPSFGEFELSNLKRVHKNVEVITNIHFSGLHPDITYLGALGQRIQSPLGDYHSKIILHSFLTGRSHTECLARFQGAEYERIGFLSEYNLSKHRLIERDRANNIRFGETFLELLLYHPSLYTMNHPTPIVFQEYVYFLASQLGLMCWKFTPEMLPNYLSHSTWWPVYAEIAEHHGLQYRMPTVFKQPDNMGGRFFEIREFVDRSYSSYRDVGSDLKHLKQAQDLLSAWAF